MRIILFFLIVLFAKCEFTKEHTQLTSQFWIPKDINWKYTETPEFNQRKTVGFRTIYFFSDSLFFIISSEQELLSNDSLAYGVEPGFSVYRGAYYLKSSDVIVDYYQIYGSFFIDKQHYRDTFKLSKNNGEIFLRVNDKDYVTTDKYTIYSRNKLKGQIRIAEDNFSE